MVQDPVASVASGFVTNPRLTTGGPFRSESKGERHGPRRMISRDVANQVYARPDLSAQATPRRRPIAIFDRKRMMKVKITDSARMKTICGKSPIWGVS